MCISSNKHTIFYRYSTAESDCNLALAINKNYIKAYARRGAARFALKNFMGAKEGMLDSIMFVCLNYPFEFFIPLWLG